MLFSSGSLDSSFPTWLLGEDAKMSSASMLSLFASSLVSLLLLLLIVGEWIALALLLGLLLVFGVWYWLKKCEDVQCVHS